jgi:XrtN system VIT domain protein
VTAPLYKEGNELYYDNIWFEGPNAAGAEETVKLEVIGGQTAGLRQASFSPGAKKVLTREGHYQPRWTISFKDKGITENGFSFGGYNYSIKPYVQQHVPVAIHSVYLDINSAWTDREVAEVWKMVQSKKVKVYYEGMETVTGENRKSLFGALQQKSFSLFPFYAVKDREHAIVITKSSGYSPSISDLEESPFHNKLQARLGSSDRVKLFQLGTAMSPYIRSLKEKRCFQFQNGSLQMLAQLLNKGEFVQDMETGDHLIVHSAGVAITRQPGDATGNAPDHLMRLFAYNHIMQQLGQKEKDTTAIIREAESAYVVSPLSSLIVLETQKDYDRFGISESGNSLKNASLANKGAVPEPGEWAIIIMLVAAFLLFVYKTKIA